MAEAQMSDDEEMRALETEVKKAKDMHWALVKLKHRLEVKLKVPPAATFSEYESFANVKPPKKKFDSVELANRAKLCLMAGGMNCVYSENGQMRFELAFAVESRVYSGYEVQLDEVENEGFRLAKYNLPYGLDIAKIVKKVPMNNFEAVPKFLQLVRACGCALLHRKKEVEDLQKYCAESDMDVNVFTSCDVTYVDLSFQSDILKLTSGTGKISFILKYSIEAYKPREIEYRKDNLNAEDQARLDLACMDFATLNLVEAFRHLKDMKGQAQDSTEVEVDSRETDKSKLQSKTFISEKKKAGAEKESKDQTMSRRKQRQTVLPFKPLVTPKKSTPRSTSPGAQKFSEYIESKSQSTSTWHISNLPQKTSTQTRTENKGESRRAGASSSHISEEYQKISTPFQIHKPLQQLEITDSDEDDISSILGDPKVQSLEQNGTPAYASTPFRQPTRRQNIAISEPNEDDDGDDDDDDDDLDEDKREQEKKRTAGTNAHKRTPVPKVFHSFRLKKYVRQSVVAGKRARRK